MYYNTTHLTGETLKRAKELTSKQDQAVFSVFADTPGCYFNSHEIGEILKLYPRSSIVRSMNTLTRLGLICKTEEQVVGKYGKLVYTWRLNQMPKGQLTLFN